MRLDVFLETETGAKFKDVLKGCAGKWEVNYYANFDEFKEVLINWGADDDEISDYADDLVPFGCGVVRPGFYKAKHGDADFVEILN
jgi:hypothetical protein